MTWTRRLPHGPLLALLGAAAIAASGCSKPPGYGSSDAIIAVVDSALMDEIEPILVEALEREVFTTRSETVFEVTFAPAQSIGEFRKWRRIVVVESFADPTLVGDLVDVDGGPVVERVEDEWARGQTIWVLAAATPEATVELVRSRADSLYREILAGWTGEQRARMWASGRDSTLYRTLVDSLGFGIVIPRIYDSAPGSATPDSRVWFAEDPRRVLSLHWVERPTSITADTVLAIRRAWGAAVFPEDSIVGVLPGAAPAPGDAGTPPDTTAPAVPVPGIRSTRTSVGDRDAVRLQGVWRGRDGTSAGVFVTWGIACGDRLVLFDGNLFAPDRDKHPYVVQFEEILSTFRCADDPA